MGFGAVADEVVGVGPHATGVVVQVLYVFELGRGERMVHGVVTLGLVVPLEQREVDDPQRSDRSVKSGRTSFGVFCRFLRNMSPDLRFM